MPITDWPACERPREKLLKDGANCLTDSELLAIFLRTGCTGKSAVDLARDLLCNFGSLRQLFNADMSDFTQAEGLGPAKYAQLQAVLEMSRRYLEEELCRSRRLDSSEHVKQYLRAKLRDQPKEVFAALFLDSQHQLIEYQELFSGTLDGASVYPREVVKQALKVNAGAVIFAHNHPSGIAEPSQADIAITRTLKKALELLDIRTLDHIIVGGNESLSLAERGYMT